MDLPSLSSSAACASSPTCPLPQPPQQQQQHCTRAVLPEECLIMIFRYLDHDRSSLHTLLQISHQFFRLVVPILYKSPFRRLESRAESWSWPERTRRQVLLLQLFLRSVEIKQEDTRKKEQKRKQKPIITRRTLYCRKQQQRQEENLAHTTTVSKRRDSPTGQAAAAGLGIVVPVPSSSTIVSPVSTTTITTTTTADGLEKRRSLRFAAVSSTLSKGRQRWSSRRPSSPLSKKESNSIVAIVPENQSDDDHLFQFDNDTEFHQGHRQQLYLNNDSYDDSDTQDDEYQFFDEDSHDNSHSEEEDDSTNDISRTSAQPELNLGPFSLSKNPQQDTDPKDWTRALQRRLGTLSRMVERGTNFVHATAIASSVSPSSSKPTGSSSPSSAPTSRLMTDYLAHYTEHDHPHLLRILPAICPSIPKECFEQLLSCSPNLASAAPPAGFLGGSLSHNPVMSLFQSSNSHSRSLDKAHAVRCRIERDLLQHSPQRIRTLSISAPRIEAILHLPITAQKRQGLPEKDTHQSRSPISSLTSTFASLLSSSPFSGTSMSSASPVPPSSMLFSAPSTWSLRSSHSARSASSSSTSSASSISSSRSSSAASTMSSDSISWEDIRPRLCQLRHLHRIEFYDIHFDFDIEVVVEFLKAHDQAYHTIREIKIGGPDDVAKSTHPGLIQVIQSVRTLKVLDMTEWREATKFLDMIPTRHLETLLLGNVRMAGNVPEDQAQEATETGTANTAEAAAAEDENSEPRCHPQIEALQQCRHLKELKMPVLIDGLLEWAVQERARRVERSVVSQCPCLYASTSPFSYRSRSMFSLSSSPSPSPAYSFSTARWDDGPRPVELERVNLSGTSSGPLMSTLVHVMDAFRDSIQTLQGTSWVDSTEVLYCEQSLSWAWMLPKLELLDLQGDVAHRFRLGSLRYCPQLRVLRLSLPHSARPSRHGAQQQQQASQDDESLYGLGGDSSDQGTVMTENDNLDYQDAADTDCTLSELFCKSDKSISKNTRRYRSCDLPHLQELKLAGNWGLCDESLVRMMQSMPRLRRLALLRCDAGSGGGGGGGGEGGKTDGRRLTGQGLIRALSCLRERVQSLEVSRAWQHELEEAYGSNNDGGDGDKKNYDNGGSARVQPVDIIYHFW